MPKVARAPREEKLSVAPEPPTESDAPLLETLRRTPGISLIDRRKRNPIAEVYIRAWPVGATAAPGIASSKPTFAEVRRAKRRASARSGRGVQIVRLPIQCAIQFFV